MDIFMDIMRRVFNIALTAQASEEEMAEVEAATKQLLDTRGGTFVLYSPNRSPTFPQCPMPRSIFLI